MRISGTKMLLERMIIIIIVPCSIVFFSFFGTQGDNYNASGYFGEQNFEYISDTEVVNEYLRIEYSSYDAGDGFEERQTNGRYDYEAHILVYNHIEQHHIHWPPSEHNSRSNGSSYAQEQSAFHINAWKYYSGGLNKFENESGNRYKRDRGQLGRKLATMIRSNRQQKLRRHHLKRRTSQNPLVLTTFIDNEKLASGKRAAEVVPLHGNIKSYSGFFEVDKKYKSYMFFWYFFPENHSAIRDKAQEIPVIVWLEGGMGHSSMFSALRSNGPIRLEQNGTLTYNEYSWAQKAHLVYFDSPVGAGFSFTKKGCYSKNNQEVAENLYTALKQYLTLFSLAENPVFLAGQSYAGKYITALGVKIDREKKKFFINFQGAAIGNGFIDPPNMLRYGAYLYQLGFIDAKQRDRFGEMSKRITSLLKNGKHKEALNVYETWVIGDVAGKRAPLLEEIVGFHKRDFRRWLMDYRHVGSAVDEKSLLNDFFKQKYVKMALKTGAIPFTFHNEKCKRALWSGLLHSEVQNLKLLLNNNYRILLYHGQMSVKNAYPLMINYVKKMRTSQDPKWKYAEKYFSAFRNVWSVDGDVAGYFSKGRNFEHLLVRNSGENVPADQPKWAQKMIESFIYRKSQNSH